MMIVAQAYIVPIVIALLIGLVAGWWIFKAVRSGKVGTDRAPPPVAGRRDGREGNKLQDEVAAAATDIAGEILGVPAHPELPGASGPPDDLQMLKGVGPRLAAQLAESGIIRFDQLARLSPNEVAILDSRMGAFTGRIARDRLVEQACYLARNDRDGFEAKFGKLGSA